MKVIFYPPTMRRHWGTTAPGTSPLHGFGAYASVEWASYGLYAVRTGSQRCDQEGAEAARQVSRESKVSL
eukprot:6650834-Pyramimonas_sp.AAC.1